MSHNGRGRRRAHKRQPLTREQAAKFERAAQRGRERMISYTLLDTGLRVAEFVSLDREEIEWQHDRATVMGKGGPFGKRTKLRVVPLSPRARAVLEAHFAVHDTIGMSVRTVERIVKAVAARAGLTRRVTPHVLRHTFATFSLQDGISLVALQKVLGHDRLETTEIYTDLAPEDALREYKQRWRRQRQDGDG